MLKVSLLLVVLVVVLLWLLSALSRFEEDAALLGAVWGWGREGAGCGREPPFLDVCFDEDEAELAKVDVDGCGAVGADGGEEV